MMTQNIIIEFCNYSNEKKFSFKFFEEVDIQINKTLR